MISRLMVALALLSTACGPMRPTTKAPWVYDQPTKARGGSLQPGTLNLPSAPIPKTHSEITSDMGSDTADTGILRGWVPPRHRNPLTLDWPMAATGVTSLYGHRPDPVTGNSLFHYGIDLSAEYGAVVNAAAAGRVIRAGWNGGHGRQVVIQHHSGYRTSYSHLSQIIVESNTAVRPGQPIGLVGNSGRSTGPHLHLEVTRYGDHLDPLEALGVPLEVD